MPPGRDYCTLYRFTEEFSFQSPDIRISIDNSPREYFHFTNFSNFSSPEISIHRVQIYRIYTVYKPCINPLAGLFYAVSTIAPLSPYRWEQCRRNKWRRITGNEGKMCIIGGEGCAHSVFRFIPIPLSRCDRLYSRK